MDFLNGIGETALYAACYYKDLNIIRILVEEYHANLNIGSELPLSAAILDFEKPRGKPSEVVHYLLQHGADVEGLLVKKNRISSALHKAADKPDHELMKILLENGAKVNFKDHNGNSALHIFLIMSFNVENYHTINGVHLLIDHGVKIDEENAYGETPLLIASAKGFGHLVQYLLDRKANPNVLCQNGCLEKITSITIYKEGEIFSPLTLAVTTNRPKIVEELLKVKGTNYPVHHPATGKVVKTPLFFAVLNNDYKMVKLLLDHGEDPNGRFSEKEGSLLHLAVMLQDKSVAYLLFVHGAKDFDIKRTKDIFTTIKCSQPIKKFEYGKKKKSYTVDESTKIAKLLVEFLTLAVHMKKIESPQNLMDMITANDSLKNHKEKCEQELKKMVHDSFVEEISLYDLLEKDEKILVFKLKDKINLIKLERTVQSKYRILNIALKIKCDVILRKAVLEKSAS